ncbi:uncharacterized protein UHOD_11657 [Ustilago sp. UG-2017b]|nr:uncharacterized protein UHOD_11657 [Ustilago sp. UG-2017b]
MHLSEDVAQYLYGQPKLKRFGEKRNPLRNLKRTSELVTTIRQHIRTLEDNVESRRSVAVEEASARLFDKHSDEDKSKVSSYSEQ